MVTSAYRYFVIVLLFAYFLGHVAPFSTNLCNHDDLIEKTKEEFQCDRKFNAKIFGNARNAEVNKTTEFCNIIRERYKYNLYQILKGTIFSLKLLI